MHLFYQSEMSDRKNHVANGKTNKHVFVTIKFKKYIISLFIVALMLPGTIYAVSSMSSESEVYSERQSFAYVVGAGDTLWSIASKYVPRKMDIREYIDQIRNENQLDSSLLSVGQRLELP